MSSSNGDAVREAAITGFGVAMLPSLIVLDAVKLDALSRSVKGLPTADRVTCAARIVTPPRARAFIDFLVDALGSEPFWDRELFN